MSAIHCPRCNTTWQQRGNQTGHCSGCHRTFGSLAAFDAHQSISESGRNVCTDPSTLKSRDGAPRFRVGIDPEGAPVWRSAKALNTAIFEEAK